MKKIISIILFIGALAVLLSLGTWQVKRLAWKNEIIKKLEVEYAQNPDKNRLSMSDFSLVSPDNLFIRYGSARGQFDYDKEILFGLITQDHEIGSNVITPLRLENGGTILVNRGWVSKEKIADFKNTGKSRYVTVTGVFRQPEWNQFTPNNSPQNDVWSKLDINDIATAKDIKNPAPVILYAEKILPDNGTLKMQADKWFPRNKHKQYALFWFALAGALIVVFGLYNRKLLQK